MRKVLAAGAALLVASSFLPSDPGAAAEPFVPVLAYADQDRLMVVDGTGATEVLSDGDGLYYGGVAYSPDGRRIAFTAGPGTAAGPSLYVMPADGSAPPEVVADRAGGFSWSPDSTRIAYAAPAAPPESEDAATDLRIVGADGSGDRLLADHDDATFGADPGCSFLSGRRIFPFSWSPDGSVIAVGFSASCFEIVVTEIGLVAADTGHVVLVGDGTSPRFSPDGTLLAFGSLEYDVSVMSAFGGPARVVATNASAPSWAPGGTALAVARVRDLTSGNPDDDVWVVPDGGRGTPRQVESTGVLAAVPRFSADGTAIAFLGYGQDNTARLFQVGAGGGEPVRLSRPEDDRVVGFDFVPSGLRVQRLAGNTRYETAVAIAEAMYPDGSFIATLARGDDFADALIAAGFSAVRGFGSPVLLTPPDRVPDSVLAALERLDVQHVQIIGGNGGVSDAVFDQLRALGYDTVRWSGQDRYDTARNVSQAIPTGGVGYLASGETFPDALAVGALANRDERPVLLTQRDLLPPATVEAVLDRDLQTVVIVGGPSAVSPAVEQALRDAVPGLEVVRVAGDTRFETAALIADRFPPVVFEVTLARGDAFPDAVAAGPIGGVRNAPTLFTDGPDRLGDATRAWLEAHAGQITAVRVLGDREAVSNAVVAEAIAAVTP